MAIYIVMFVITAVLAFVSEKCSNTKIKILLKVCSIVPLGLLAGLRDISIGSDQTSYVYDTYMNSHYVGITDIHYSPSPFYGVFVWVLTRIVDTYWFNLLCIQLFINGLIYCSLYQLGKQYAWVGITLYNLLGYCYTLNYVRQAMALAICLFALRFALQRSFLKFCLALIIAMGFHQTAIVAFPLYLIFSIDASRSTEDCGTRDRSRNRYSFLVKYCILCAMIIAVVFIATNLEIFSIFKESYADQLNYGGSESVGMIVFFAAFAFAFLLFGTPSSMKARGFFQEPQLLLNGKNLAFGLLIGVVMYSLSYVGRELFRLSLYYLLLLPHYTVVKLQLLPKTQRSIMIGSILAIAGLFWAWKFVWQNVGAVTPYEITPLI